MSEGPLVSVIMSVHNGARFLSDSIESILKQTFSNFEFIIVDDGSTDSSREIISRHAALDARIIWLHRENKGLTKSLNEALGMARGAFIARQDADDISLPHRLRTMVDFLQMNPIVVVAGSWCEQIDDEGRAMWPLMFPVDHDRICWWMLGITSILHPSAVIRHASIAQYGSYNENYVYAQDYELWTRWIRLGARFANVPEVLIKYRTSDDQISKKHNAPQTNSSAEAATNYVNFLLGDNLQRNEILGVRQLTGWWPMDANGVRAIPIVLRLLTLPRFKRSMRFAWSTRSLIAKRIAFVVRQFAGKDRKRALWGLAIAVRISPRVIMERDWWASLLRHTILFY